jgi:hypothetical protein
MEAEGILVRISIEVLAVFVDGKFVEVGLEPGPLGD